MMTFNKQLEAVIRENVHKSNDEMDIELENSIVNCVLEKKLRGIKRVDGDKVLGVQSKKGKDPREVAKLEPNGAWIYSEPTVKEWVFERFDTVEQAVREAARCIGDVKVICNGVILQWSLLSDSVAVYEDTLVENRFIKVSL